MVVAIGKFLDLVLPPLRYAWFVSCMTVIIAIKILSYFAFWIYLL